jgi:hypothetical protein
MSNIKIYAVLFACLIAFWGWVIFIMKGGV